MAIKTQGKIYGAISILNVLISSYAVIELTNYYYSIKSSFSNSGFAGFFFIESITLFIISTIGLCRFLRLNKMNEKTILGIQLAIILIGHIPMVLIINGLNAAYIQTTIVSIFAIVFSWKMEEFKAYRHLILIGVFLIANLSWSIFMNQMV